MDRFLDLLGEVEKTRQPWNTRVNFVKYVLSLQGGLVPCSFFRTETGVRNDPHDTRMTDLSPPSADSPNANLDTVSTTVEPLEVSRSPQERFSEYLQSRGLRQTSQRKFLIGQVFSQHDHFDA